VKGKQTTACVDIAEGERESEKEREKERERGREGGRGMGRGDTRRITLFAISRTDDSPAFLHSFFPSSSLGL